MKIIEIGVCIDNYDPRGFGRIRARNIDELDSARQNSIQNWEPWSKNDPFIYTPFLPNHINIIPKVGQAVKIIRYDNERDLQNQEYITGPFTTPHDFSGQVDEQQITETTYGQRSKKTPDIKSFSTTDLNNTDAYIRSESIGSLPRINDIAISGNYGSDIILTEHGVQLRAGKLISKESAKGKQKELLYSYPIYSEKQSRISLKKFSQTVKLDTKEIKEILNFRGDIKHVLEYSLDSITSPTKINFYLYNVKENYGEKYKTDVFNINTQLDIEITNLIFQKEVILSSNDKLTEAYVLIRDFISKLDIEKLIDIDNTLPNTFAHPFYFRPTNGLRLLTNSSSFLEKIVYYDRVTDGMIFNQTSINPPKKSVIKKIEYLKKVNDKEQTFASIVADNIVYLSQSNPGVDGKKIDFTKLDRYEYTQEDYFLRIIPNTFATVRGEKLIEILDLMSEILLNHKHGILTEPKYYKSTIDKLKTLIERAKLDMLNNSIRIN